MEKKAYDIPYPFFLLSISFHCHFILKRNYDASRMMLFADRRATLPPISRIMVLLNILFNLSLIGLNNTFIFNRMSIEFYIYGDEWFSLFI